MFWTNKAVAISGIIAILLAIGIIINVGSSFSSGDYSPFEKDEVGKFLTDINDNETSVIAGGASGIVVDGFLGVALAASFFVLFRDRSRLLATLFFAGLLIEGAVSLFVDGNNILLTVIAKDFVRGGPTGVAAGDPSILEVGRYVGMITLAFGNISLTALGLGLGALGILIARAPAGAINPPRWLGWVAVFAGACAELAWFVVVIDPAFVFFIGNLLSSLVFLFGMGIWLLRHQDLQPATA
jgi:hypothetical protein